MSDHDDVPELSPAARAFLTQHQSTGEPSPEALERGKSRLLAAPVVTLPAPAPRRPWLRSEWMAAAAVLVVVVGGQGLYLLHRSQQEPTAAEKAELSAVEEAWRIGDVDGAAHLASANCNSAACGTLRSSLERAQALSKRLDQLSPAELEELGALDATLGGAPGALTEKLTERRAQLPADAALTAKAQALLAQGEAQLGAQHLPEARRLFHQCLLADPALAGCARGLGATYEKLLVAEKSVAFRELSVRYYMRYLELAPDARDVPDVRNFLVALDPPAPADGPKALLARATELKKARQLEQAREVLLECTRTAPTFPDCFRVLGTVYAALATQTNDPKAMALGRAAFERFVELAPADDDYLPKVSAILEQAASDEESAVPLTPARAAEVPGTRQVLKAADEARLAGDWQRVRALANLVLKDEPGNAEAKRLVDEVRTFSRELYLRGYQLRDADPHEAGRLFLEVTQVLPSDDDTHQKARARLLELRAQFPDILTAPQDVSRPGPVGGSVALRVGMDGRITVSEGIQRVAVGDTEVADVRMQGTTTVLITGRTVGKTTLLVWRSDNVRQSWLIDVRR